MAKIWVKGYTKPDGTKVKGYYRNQGTKGTTYDFSGTSKEQLVSILNRRKQEGEVSGYKIRKSRGVNSTMNPKWYVYLKK